MNEEQLKRGQEITSEKKIIQKLIDEDLSQSKKWIHEGRSQIQIYYNGSYKTINANLNESMREKFNEKCLDFLDNIENLYTRQIKYLDKEFDKL